MSFLSKLFGKSVPNTMTDPSVITSANSGIAGMEHKPKPKDPQEWKADKGTSDTEVWSYAGGQRIIRGEPRRIEQDPKRVTASADLK